LISLDLVSETIQKAGYATVGKDLHVGGVRFAFDEVLIGTRARLSVVLVETLSSSEGLLAARVSAISRALDYVRSRVTLTLVLVGVSELPDEIRDVGQYARVLFVRTGESIEDDLRVLFPIVEPPVVASPSDPMEELEAGLPKRGAAISALQALRLHADEREALRAFLSEPLEKVDVQ